ncbi:hypothetical protein CYMTET_43589 [Cymbomonas tetramitiformis]|uniref:Uncharacterized protein n=1 Tax=Cymbomonas tetramitiformis TaxID=36881 RepID=A0AAE0EZT9_9CHLO|nr:hypothetical protein CYMTET_43589 [Cymbomonas tetramitiformis]
MLSMAARIGRGSLNEWMVPAGMLATFFRFFWKDKHLAVKDSPNCSVEALRWVLEQPRLGRNGPLFVTKDTKGKLGPPTHTYFAVPHCQHATS